MQVGPVLANHQVSFIAVFEVGVDEAVGQAGRELDGVLGLEHNDVFGAILPAEVDFRVGGVFSSQINDAVEIGGDAGEQYSLRLQPAGGVFDQRGQRGGCECGGFGFWLGQPGVQFVFDAAAAAVGKPGLVGYAEALGYLDGIGFNGAGG
jgi:hypothetical protein